MSDEELVASYVPRGTCFTVARQDLHLHTVIFRCFLAFPFVFPYVRTSFRPPIRMSFSISDKLPIVTIQAWKTTVLIY